MNRLGLAVIVALGITEPCAPAGLLAQTLEFSTVSSDPPIHAKAQVRVRIGSRWIYGRAVAASDDTLRLALGPFRQVREIVLTPTSTLDVCSRQSRLWGALKGAGFMVLATGALVAPMVSAFRGDASDVIAVTGQLLRATPVIPVGAAFGALMPGDRWRRVNLKAKP